MATETLNLDSFVRQQQASRERLFQEHVRACANGEPLDVESSAGVLERAGRTVEEFNDAVKLLGHRRDLKKTVEAAANTDRERAEITERIKLANAAFEEARSTHTRVVAPLAAREQELIEVAVAARRASTDLIHTAAPWMVAKKAELYAKTSGLNDRRGQLRREHNIAAAKLVENIALGRVTANSDIDRLKLRIDEIEREIAGLQLETTKLFQAMQNVD